MLKNAVAVLGLVLTVGCFVQTTLAAPTLQSLQEFQYELASEVAKLESALSRRHARYVRFDNDEDVGIDVEAMLQERIWALRNKITFIQRNFECSKLEDLDQELKDLLAQTFDAQTNAVKFIIKKLSESPNMSDSLRENVNGLRNQLDPYVELIHSCLRNKTVAYEAIDITEK